MCVFGFDDPVLYKQQLSYVTHLCMHTRMHTGSDTETSHCLQMCVHSFHTSAKYITFTTHNHTPQCVHAVHTTVYCNTCCITPSLTYVGPAQEDGGECSVLSSHVFGTSALL